VARVFGASDSLRCAIGALWTRTLGNTTYAVVMNVFTDSVWRTPIALHSSGGTAAGYIQLNPSNKVVFGHASGSAASTFTVTGADGWVLIACSKASGTATPRMHKYVFSTGAWTHQDGDASISDGASAGAGGTVRFGDWQGGDRLQGRIHVAGVFGGVLADAQVENLAAGLSPWIGYAAMSVWPFDQQDQATQKVRDLCGTSHEATRSGTSVSNLSDWGWTYGGSPIAVTSTAVSTDKPVTDSGTLSDSSALTVATVLDVSDSGTTSEHASVATTQAGPRLPSLFIEAGFGGDSADTSTYMHLDDPTRGVLDTATLAPDFIWSDITQYVSSGSLRRGSNRADGPILKYETGTCSLTLRNEDRRFDPTNLEGPYVSYTVASGSNTVVNSNTGFENNTTAGWTAAGGALTADTAQFHSGSYSGKLVPDGVTFRPTITTDQYSVDADQWYRISIWARCAATWGIHLCIYGYDADTDQVMISTSGTTTLAAGVWTNVIYTAKMPSDAVTGSAQVVMEGTPAGATILWTDDAEFSLMPEAPGTQVRPMTAIRVRAGWAEPDPGIAVQDVGTLPSDDSSLIYYLGSPGVAMNANPSFDTNTTGWTGLNASISRDTGTVYPEQVASLKITPNGSSASGGAVTDHTAVGTVAPGHTYRAYIWAYSPAGWSDLRTAVSWYDSSDSLIQTDTGTQVTVAAATWTQLSDDYVAPPNASRIRLQAYHGGTPAGTDVWYIWNATVALVDSPVFLPIVLDDWVAHYDNSNSRYDTVPRRVTGVTSLGNGYYQIALSQPLSQTAAAGDYLRGIDLVYDLFLGFADNWDINWDGPNWSEVQVNASDQFKVLNNVGMAEVGAIGNGDTVSDRLNRILDTLGWSQVSRAINDTDTTVLQDTTYGTDALSELQLAADSGLGELYIDGAGRIFYRGLGSSLIEARSAHSQATFGDGGGDELPYTNVEISYDDAQLVNDATISRANGTPQNAFDSSSIQRYLRHTFERTDLQMQSDTIALTFAQWLVAQRKEPELRFDALTIFPLSDDTLLFPQALGREIGDRITVLRRPPGGGTVISRDEYIRGIAHDFTPGSWVTTWTLQSAQDLSLLTLDDADLGALDNDNALGY